MEKRFQTWGLTLWGCPVVQPQGAGGLLGCLATESTGYIIGPYAWVHQGLQPGIVGGK